MGSDVLDLDPELVGHEPDDPEDDKAGKEAGEAVAQRHDERIPENTYLVRDLGLYLP